MKTPPPLSPFLLALALSATIGLVGWDKKSATAALADVVASAETKENTAKAASVIARLETAVAGKDKLGAEDILAELEKLNPADPRMAGLRDRVATVPGPKSKLSVDLGGGVKMEFVLLRPGSFVMGSDSGSVYATPAHKVTLTKPFYLGKFEVTQEQWQAVMGGNPSLFKGPKLPVENVSWNRCQRFLTKLQEKLPGRKFALPTEAQWEYACRAGSTTKFSYGDDESSLGEYAWFSGNSGNTTHPVGGKKPNAWGLHDLHGNVREWCADWYANYPVGVATDPQGPSSGSHRVLRGGSFFNFDDPVSFTASYRASLYSPGVRSTDFGFRLMLEVESVP